MFETPDERRRKILPLYPPWFRRVRLAFWLLVMLTSIIYLLRVKGPSRTTNPVLIQSAP
jgi:hypothetical protein